MYRGAGILFCVAEEDQIPKILLGKRLSGIWSIPGGGSKKGETLWETAWRETEEEIGFLPDNVKYEKLFSLPYPLGIFGFKWKTFVLKLSECPEKHVFPDRDAPHAYEFSEVRWFQINRLPSKTHYLLYPAICWLAKKYIMYRGAGILFCVAEEDQIPKILLGKRRSGIWSIPGGGSKKGETLWETARRETEEEIGFLPDNVKYEKLFSLPYPLGIFGFKLKTFVLKLSECPEKHVFPDRNAPHINGFSEVRWFQINRLPSKTHYLLYPAICWLKKKWWCTKFISRILLRK
ncbi:NUDIX hydrolase [Desulfococcaceae bacterium HSG8]|nr:NUDIX hydrolase [Desulfococcaceae bacterium HSG8]